MLGHWRRSRLCVRARRARIRARTQAFPGGETRRHQGPEISARFNPTIFNFRRGEHEYGTARCHRRLRQMAGDNPDETLAGASDEFLSKTNWAFPGLIMGPVANPRSQSSSRRSCSIKAPSALPTVNRSWSASSPRDSAEHAGWRETVISVADHVGTWRTSQRQHAPEPRIAIRYYRNGAAATATVAPIASTARSR